MTQMQRPVVHMGQLSGKPVQRESDAVAMPTIAAKATFSQLARHLRLND